MARKAANLPTWRPDDATIDAIAGEIRTRLGL